MDQRGFWLLMRRRWLAVASFGVIGILVGAVYTFAATSQYVADSELFVAAVGADSASDLALGSNYSQQQARNLAAVVTREVVLDPVIERLDLDISAPELRRRVSASVPLNTSLISISVTDTSPERAAKISNAIATSLQRAVLDLLPERSDGTAPVRLESVQRAPVPARPAAPNAKLAVLLGFATSMVLGVTLVVLRELTGAKVRTPEQVRDQFGLPVLGTIAYHRGAVARPIVTRGEGMSLRAEEFRQVRTNLHFVQSGQPTKVFVFTSSVPGEGKSSTTANVAVTLAASGSRVVLVECDLRAPSLGGYLDLEDSVGLTTVLAGDAELDQVMQTWGPDRLHVLLAGQIPPNPSELLDSSAAQALFTELRSRFDILILDTPPLMPVTDATVVARKFGGAIIVIGCGKVDVHMMRKAIDALDASGTPILGAIVNMTPLSRRERARRTYVKTSPDNDVHGMTAQTLRDVPDGPPAGDVDVPGTSAAVSASLSRDDPSRARGRGSSNDRG